MSTMSTTVSSYDPASTRVSEKGDQLWDPIWGFVFNQDYDEEESLEDISENFSTRAKFKTMQKEETFDKLLYGSDESTSDKGKGKFSKKLRKRSWLRRKKSNESPKKESNSVRNKIHARKLRCFSKTQKQARDPDEEIPRVRSRSTRIFEDVQPGSDYVENKQNNQDIKKLVCVVPLSDYDSSSVESDESIQKNSSAISPKREQALRRLLSGKKIKEKEAKVSMNDSKNSIEYSDGGASLETNDQSDKEGVSDDSSLEDDTSTDESGEEESALELFFKVICFQDEPIPDLNKSRRDAERKKRKEMKDITAQKPRKFPY